ncbi:MAG: hypothetical protein R6X33_00040 [Candidatus Brocadiia bacterium]
MPGGSKTWSKLRWGCAGGCFGLVVIAIILVIATIWFLLGSVPVVPEETFLLPEATAFAVVRIEPDDTLMAELPFRVASHPEVREELRKQDVDPRKLEGNVAKARENVRKMAPVQMVALLMPPEEEEGEFSAAAAFSMRRYSRLIRMLLRGGKEGETSEYKEAAIVAPADEPLLAVRGNNFMRAERMETLHTWVDRLVEQRARQEAAAEGETPRPELELRPRLREAYERMDRSLPVRFACLNESGELAHLAERIEREEVLEALEAIGALGDGVAMLSGSLEPLNETDAELSLRWDCRDDEHAAGLEAGFRRMTAEMPAGRHLRDVRLDRPEPSVFRLRVRIADFADFVARAGAAGGEDATPPSP